MNRSIQRTGCSLLALMFTAGAVVRAQDVRLDFAAANGPVYAMAQSGNTLYIGGEFTRVGMAGGGGVPLDAVTGMSLRGFPKVGGGQVYAVVTDGNGGWYIGGSFTTVGGLRRTNLAHILSDNTVGSWDPEATIEQGEPRFPYASVSALAVADGTVYVGGRFTHLSGQLRNNIGAVDAVTGAATTWDPDATIAPDNPGEVNALLVDGSTVYAAGRFFSIGGARRSNLAGLDRSTGLATSLLFRNNSFYGLAALALAGGRLYVGGSLVYRFGDEDRRGIAAIDLASGSVVDWNPFHPPFGNSYIASIVARGNVVYVSGGFENIGGQPRRSLAALDADTGLATSWDPQSDTNYGVWALALRGSWIYASGEFTSIGGQQRHGLAALDIDTGLATPWAPDLHGGFCPGCGSTGAPFVLAAGDGAVYAGGGPFIIEGASRRHLAAVDVPSGEVTSWNPDPDGAVSTLAVKGGVVYAGGKEGNSSPPFTTIGGQPRAALAAIDATTGLATDWNPDPQGAGFFGAEISSIALSGTTVYVGGAFSRIGGRDRTNLAALNATTGVATGWHPDVIVHWVDEDGVTHSDPGTISALLASGSTLYVGGWFDRVDNRVRTGIAAFHQRSGVVMPWNPRAILTFGISPVSYAGQVRAIAEKAGTIYVGGQFTEIGGQTRVNVGAIDAATGLATAWDAHLGGSPFAYNEWVVTLAVGGGTLYAGGTFDHAGGQERNGLVALDARNGTVRDWNPISTQPFSFFSFGGALLASGNTVFAGGGFFWTSESPQSYLAAIEAARGAAVTLAGE